MKTEKLIASRIREVANWPKKGIIFRDMSPLIEDGDTFAKTIDTLAAPYLKSKIDKVVGIDARGFILAAAVAYKLKSGLVMVRKKGKLPAETISRKYSLEYASNILEIHQDSIGPGERVLVVDDVLATGGTMKATVELVKALRGKIVGISFLIELLYLNGRKKLRGYNIKSLLRYR